MLQALSSVPVRVYSSTPLRRTALAVTLLPVEALRLAEGCHRYVVAPDAVSAVKLPGQMETAAEIPSTGKALTVTGIRAVAGHPRVVPVRVYSWTPLRMTALAVTLLPVEADKPASGDQE